MKCREREEERVGIRLNGDGRRVEGSGVGGTRQLFKMDACARRNQPHELFSKFMALFRFHNSVVQTASRSTLSAVLIYQPLYQVIPEIYDTAS